MGRIVVGVDGSEGSLRALRWAVAEARARHAQLAIVHASYPAYVDPYPFLPLDRLTIEKAAWRLLDDIVAGIDTQGLDRPLDKIVVPGPAGRALLDTAKGADLLVVGSRGRGSIAGLLLGSVSHHVVNHATCPVVVVPPDE